MTFPDMQINVLDPGIPSTPNAPENLLISGVCSDGPVDEIIAISSLGDVRSTLGYGPLAEDVALCLQLVGGPVYAVRHDVAGTSVNETLSAVGSDDIDITGTAYESFSVIVEILSGNRFRYTLCAFPGVAAVFSQPQTIPVSGTFLIPNTGLTITFNTVSPDYNEGAVYSTQIDAPEVGIVDLGNVATAVRESSLRLTLWLVSGIQSDSTVAAALAAAFHSHLQQLTQSFRFVRGFIDVGSYADVSDVLDAAQDWTGTRVVPGYGLCSRPSTLPFTGFAYRRASVAAGLGVRAIRELISSDLSRTASGPDDAVFGISFDGDADRRLDAEGISTYRTWPGIPGVYFSGAKLKAPAGSDFTDLQFGRVVDTACRGAFVGQFPFVSEGFRTIAGGAIDPMDAADVVRSVDQVLEDLLVTPLNARGRAGHVSSVEYSIDLQHNLNTTHTIISKIDIRPLGYAKRIETFVSLTLGGE